MDDTRSLGFHRNPSDLTLEERRIVIHSNCWNEDGLLIRHTLRVLLTGCRFLSEELHRRFATCKNRHGP